MRMRLNAQVSAFNALHSNEKCSSSLPILQQNAYPSSTTAHPSLTTIHPFSTTAHPASTKTVPESHPKHTRKQQHVKDSRARKWAAMWAQHPPELLSLKSVTLKHRQGLEGLQAAVDLEHFITTSSGLLGVMLPSIC